MTKGRVYPGCDLWFSNSCPEYSLFWHLGSLDLPARSTTGLMTPRIRWQSRRRWCTERRARSATIKSNPERPNTRATRGSSISIIPTLGPKVCT